VWRGRDNAASDNEAESDETGRRGSSKVLGSHADEIAKRDQCRAGSAYIENRCFSALVDVMRLLGHRTIPANSTLRSESSPYLTVRFLRAIADFAETHGWLLFVIVTLGCGWGHVSMMASRNLDHDEIYTFYIAQAPTVRQLLELTRTVDFHPPLSYLLVRASFAIFGVSSWSCRLPFMLAFVLSTALLFWFVRRLLSPLHGLIAALFLWSIPFAYLSAVARPYSLLLCFSTLLLVSWYEASHYETTNGDHSSGRGWALAAVTASGFGLLLSHVLGMLPYAAVLAAELLRLSIRREPDWRLWAALLVPLPSVLTHMALIRTHSTMLFAQEYRVSPLRIFSFYWESIRFVGTPLALIALLSLFWPVLRKQTPAIPSANARALGAPFGFLLFALSLIPVAVGFLFSYSGAYFFDRYGIVWLIPLTLVPVLVLGYCTDRNQLAGTVVALLLAVLLFFNSTGRAWLLAQVSGLFPPKIAVRLLYIVAMAPIYPPPNYPAVPLYLQTGLATAPLVAHLDTVEPDLPLVAHTALTFLELDRKESAQVTQRLYMLTDEEAASSIAHDTVFVHFERVKEAFPIRGKIEPYCPFIAAHPRFLVVGAYNHPLGWVLRKLDRDGAELRVVGICGGNTEPCQIYEVNVRNAQCKNPADSTRTIDK
jgi:Dolichyl-phosphate-mannose-protein mannosyltransferase